MFDKDFAAAFPESAKLREVADKSQMLGEFIEEWLRGKGIFLAVYAGGEEEEIVPWNGSIVKLLAEYFDIDLKKVEEEKREMLRQLGETYNASSRKP